MQSCRTCCEASVRKHEPAQTHARKTTFTACSNEKKQGSPRAQKGASGENLRLLSHFRTEMSQNMPRCEWFSNFHENENDLSSQGSRHLEGFSAQVDFRDGKLFSLDCVPVLQFNRGKTENDSSEIRSRNPTIKVGYSAIEPPAPLNSHARKFCESISEFIRKFTKP